MLDHFLFPFPYPVGKDGRVVQGGSLRYCSLRRRGFEPHLLHFYFFYSPPLYTIIWLLSYLYLWMASEHSRQCGPLVRERSWVRFPQRPCLFCFFMLLIFFLSLLLFGLVAQWKRVCLLSRRLWVRPPPGSFSTLLLFIFANFSFFLYLLFTIYLFNTFFSYFCFLISYFITYFFFLYPFFFSVLPYFSFLFLCCESKSGRVV